MAESLRRLGLELSLRKNGSCFVPRIEAGLTEVNSGAVNLRKSVGLENRKLRWRVGGATRPRLAPNRTNVSFGYAPASKPGILSHIAP